MDTSANGMLARAAVRFDPVLVRKYDGSGRATPRIRPPIASARPSTRKIMSRRCTRATSCARSSRSRSTCTSRSAIRCATTAPATRSSPGITDRPAKYLEYARAARSALVGERRGPAQPVSQLHLGGGSPTFLSQRGMSTLMRMLPARSASTPNAEISIEVDPRTVDAGSSFCADSGSTDQSSASRISTPRCRRPCTACRRIRDVRG